MSELVVFLKARLDDDERVAKGAERTSTADWIQAVLRSPFDFRTNDHIARHDPARVLREVEAKRRILARHKPGDPSTNAWAAPWCEGCGYEGSLSYPRTEHIDECPELRDLAIAYADHPDYREEWRP